MEIRIYKTNEITDKLWIEVVTGFNLSFASNGTNKENLIRNYCSNHFEFSYHAVCFDNDKVIGFNSILPSYYTHGDKKIKVGLSGSTFVLKEYRKDIFILERMFKALEEYCKKEGIVFFIGVPNANSYAYTVKLMKWKNILDLSYYVLPIKISNILNKQSISIFNFISYFCARIWLFFNIVFSYVFNTTENVKKYRMAIDEDYYNKRFLDEKYKVINEKNNKYSYVIVNEDGIKAAYIMDFRSNSDKSYKSLVNSVRHIMKHENIDIIMYVGTMNLKQALFFKIPKKLEPKKLPLVCKIIDDNFEEDYLSVSNPDNWDFSLMNLDVR
ncbi:GNAT family N-acetyltransferase [Bacteroidales bacterium OttesenSCG-928-M06]|nr:GNAT family N-acetyltransferase [Bacteroidales bacterium OttesenSCG-928-M06]